MNGVLWLTWRQQRLGVAAAVVLAVAGAVYVQVFDDLWPFLGSLYLKMPETSDLLVRAVLLLVGVFWGAPLLARQFQEGTHRMVFTQSVSRRRWFTAQVGLAAVVAAVVAAVASSLLVWHAWSVNLLQGGYWVSWERLGSVPALPGIAAGWGERLADSYLPAVELGSNYSIYPPVALGYALLFLAVGVAAGVVLRRTVPAMALTLLVCGACYALADYVRPQALALAITTDGELSRKVDTAAEGGGVDGLRGTGTEFLPAREWFWIAQGAEAALCLAAAAAVMVFAWRRVRRMD
ncbi:hypothetical protein FHX37_2071 [Haloactinospora alba]|uniref:ABC-2 family transporter n=1 Tax=Haloactinospora alba TaxID=405555 RepID=A0A543NJU9_9ACTN|nr:hypothetical protein [Haloactinospora alba]TQN32143.1 hypothetical protein FHX37_2071 [Haloactinospora alba]